MSGAVTLSPSLPAAIAVRDVAQRFGDVRALRDVTFKVPVGSICGLVGANGAGKTTTMKLIVTELRPSDGSVTVLGHDTSVDPRAVRACIGYMPDAAGLYEELNLVEYLGFFAAFHGIAPARRKLATETAMELAGVTKFATRRLGGLSKGERQRVLLARTVIHDPELFVLDEPADGLDPIGRVELRELLLLLHERGKTIFLSSHVLADLEMIATHVVLLAEGRVVFSGTRDRLLSRGGGLCSVHVECLHSGEEVAARVSLEDGVTVIAADERSVDFEMDGDPVKGAGMLRLLVEEGHPLTSFARRNQSLEEAYVRLSGDAGDAP